MGLLEFARDFAVANWDNAIMWVIGGILIYLAIKKDMEPALLLPMGFGAILINIPFSGAEGVMSSLFAIGIENLLPHKYITFAFSSRRLYKSS